MVLTQPTRITRGTDIILVGNGPSLLGQRWGSYIDAFSQIVRFNGFELDGFEEHVGTRTTIWSRWYALPTLRPMNELDRIWLNMPIHERSREKITKAMTFLGSWRHKAHIIPDFDVAAELQQTLFGGPDSVFWPSSGLLAIAHAVACGWEVTIVGFDSWEKEPFHYYGQHDRSNSHHVSALEREYIADLVRKGAVKLLSRPHIV